jgi:hypothetical protein
MKIHVFLVVTLCDVLEEGNTSIFLDKQPRNSGIPDPEDRNALIF